MHAPGGSSIAQLMSNQLQRTVNAYYVGTYFSSSNASNDTTFGGLPQGPSDLPDYMVPVGPPHRKPQYIPFVPRN
jgi:hypothetical protein